MSVYLIRPTICFEAGDWYIGSTTETIKKRFISHKTKYRSWLKKNNNKSCSSYTLFTKYGIENCEIVAIETNIPHDNLRWRERFYIERWKSLNIKKPILNKEEKKIYMKAYFEANNEKIKKQNKAIYEQNKEEINQKKKKYYEQNKEEINQKRRLQYNLKKQNNI